MVKRKRPNTPLGDGDSAPSSVGGSGVPSPVSLAAADVAMDEVKEEKRPVFKDPDFQHSSKTSNKKRAWRSLKQIIAQERALQWGEDFVHYSTIDAPPSFKPAKKYSDISGLLVTMAGTSLSNYLHVLGCSIHSEVIGIITFTVLRPGKEVPWIDFLQIFLELSTLLCAIYFLYSPSVF